MNRNLSLFVVVLFLMSCTQYQTKAIKPASKANLPVTKNITGKKQSVKTPELSAWRTMFKDENLRELIDVALDNNRDIKMAVANVEVIRGAYQLKQSSKTPMIGASAGGNFTQSGRSHRMSTQYNLGVGVSNYELDFFDRIKSLNDEALADYFASIEGKRTAKLSIIAETAKAYYGYQLALKKANLTDATLKAANKTRTLLNMRVNAGLSAKDVVDQTDAMIAQFEAQRAGNEQEKITYKSVLKQLAGADIDRFLTRHDISSQSLSLSVPNDLSSTVLLNRPDVIAKELGLYAADANINAARAAFFPSVSFSSNMGFSTMDLTKLFRIDSFLWQFAPSIRIPLFDDPMNVANLDLAEARKIIAIADYEKSIQTAFAEVYRTALKEEELMKSLNAVRKAVTAQRKVLASTTAKYDAGLINYVEVLRAKQNLYASQSNEHNAMLALLQNKVDLYKALGGGDDLDEKSRQAFFEALALRADQRFQQEAETVE